MEKVLKILIVEDDETVLNFEQKELAHEGYLTVVAKDGKQALELFESEAPDLVILDIMLPELNGIEVLRRIRKVSQTPVILVTAKDQVFDKVIGLTEGADDYISKPFAVEELFARIVAVLRRSKVSVSSSNVLKNRNIELNTQSMVLSVKISDEGSGEAFNNEKTYSLSKIEFLLLKYFMENQQKPLSRNEIIDTVWGEDCFIEEGTVDVYINYLRSKIDQQLKTVYIKTVRGVGYMMVQ